MADSNKRFTILNVICRLLMFYFLQCSSIEGVHGQCSTPLVNLAVYEGTQNTMIFCNRQTTVSYTVKPASDPLGTYQITTNSDVVDPKLRYLYSANQTGLLIKIAQGNASTRPSRYTAISTAGLYVLNRNSTNTTGAKLVVVRSPPTCSCTTINSTKCHLTCSLVYSDFYYIQPIFAIMTWYTPEYVTVKTETPEGTLIGGPLIYYVMSTSVLTVDASDPTTYRCNVQFSKPNLTVAFVAANAPTFFDSCSTQCPWYSNGSLTKRPANIGSVAGSINIALECATIFGTNTIRWSFTPFGSVSNKSIWISYGYQLLVNADQQYELHATVNSSILIVLQLSSMTEGNYRCTDNVESASALLLVIPSPISMEPLFGPIAGGTNITITGFASINYLWQNIGSYVPDIRDVRHIYFGEYLTATSIFLLLNGWSTLELVTATPRTTEESSGQPLPVILEFWPTHFNMTPLNLTFNKAFTYLPNPEITDIYPKNFIVNGGTLLDITGQSLSSVAKPTIQLTVFIHRTANNGSTSNISTTSSTRVCTVPPKNDTYMQCPLPPLNLPTDFLEILNSLYSTNTSRRRRNTRSTNEFTPRSHSLVSRSKRDANVLTVRGPNGIDRADIYLGFILDGYNEYENINDALPDTRFIFYSAPEINSSNELLEYDPSEDELIYVKGRYMLRGCRLRDYLVHIGDQICINNELTDNQLSCKPPKEEPSTTINDTILCNQRLSISIYVGYKQYQYACLTYAANPRRLALIVGLTVGLVAFAILLTIVIICIVRCRKKINSQEETGGNTGGHELDNQHIQNADKQESEEGHVNIIHTRSNTTLTMFQLNDEYLASSDIA